MANTYYIGLDGNQAHQNFQGTPGERTEQDAAEGAAEGTPSRRRLFSTSRRLLSSSPSSRRLLSSKKQKALPPEDFTDGRALEVRAFTCSMLGDGIVATPRLQTAATMQPARQSQLKHI